MRKAKDIKKIFQTIKRNKRFLLSTHVNPDPDGLCSELAMAEYLRSLGKKVIMAHHEKLPHRFFFLPGARRVKSLKEDSRPDYDAAIVLDCGDLERIGRVKNLLRQGKILVNIDHHITNVLFGDLNCVDPKASSTAELLYLLLQKAGCRFNAKMARLLYAGIMTDTGSFRYENTSAQTHRIVSELMAFPFSAQELYTRFYEVIPLEDMRNFVRVMHHFEVLFDGRIICLELNQELLSQFSDHFDLRDAIFKFLRSIKGVEAFVIFTQVEGDQTRVNFRSTGTMNVARLAEHFQGGGHRRASGCLLNLPLKKAREKILEQIRIIL